MRARATNLLVPLGLSALSAFAFAHGKWWLPVGVGVLLAVRGSDSYERREKVRREAEWALPPGVPIGDPAPTASLATSRSRPVATLPGHAVPARAVAFSPDGRLLATGDSSGTGILWDVADPTHPARVATLNHDAAIEALAFRPHASLLATACGGAVTVWDVTEPARPVPIITLHHLYRRRRHALRAVAFSPDGRLLACGGGAGTTLWDLTDPAQPTRAADLRRRRWRSTVRAVGFSPDGRLLVTGHGQAGTRAAVLWDVSNPAQPTRAAAFQPQPARTFANHRPTVHAVAFVPDRRLLATASGAVVRTDHEFRVRPEERDSAVTLWDLTDPARPVRSVTLTQRSGSTLALSERRIGVRAGALTGHTAAVRALAVSADGRQLATGGDDSTVLLWDLTDPAHPRHTLTLRHVDAVHAVGFSPDGRLLASGSRYGDPGLWRTT